MNMKTNVMIAPLAPLYYILVLIFLCGCIPIPHYSPRSDEVRGRILDANTHLPISGAKVFLAQAPHHAVYTDKEGRFRLKATRNFHLAYVGGDGDWPSKKDSDVEISCPGYFSIGGGYSGSTGDILLKPTR